MAALDAGYCLELIWDCPLVCPCSIMTVLCSVHHPPGDSEKFEFPQSSLSSCVVLTRFFSTGLRMSVQDPQRPWCTLSKGSSLYVSKLNCSDSRRKNIDVICDFLRFFFFHFCGRVPDQKHLKVGKVDFGSWCEGTVHHGEEGVMARAWSGSAVGTQREMNACASLFVPPFFIQSWAPALGW